MIGIMAGMAQKDSYAATQLCLAVLLVTTQLALCSLTRGWTCPLCATSGAGRVCAQLWRSPVAVHRPAGQTSTGASGKIYYIFYVNMYFDPEVDSRRGILDIISTSSIWQFLRQIQRLLEEFQVFLYVKVDTNPEVDFRAGPGAFRTRKSGHYSYEQPEDV